MLFADGKSKGMAAQERREDVTTSLQQSDEISSAYRSSC